MSAPRRGDTVTLGPPGPEPTGLGRFGEFGGRFVPETLVPALEEATYILVQSYDALGLTALRDDARRVMDKSFPNSAYATRGFKANSDPWWKLW